MFSTSYPGVFHWKGGSLQPWGSYLRIKKANLLASVCSSYENGTMQKLCILNFFTFVLILALHIYWGIQSSQVTAVTTLLQIWAVICSTLFIIIMFQMMCFYCCYSCATPLFSCFINYISIIVTWYSSVDTSTVPQLFSESLWILR